MTNMLDTTERRRIAELRRYEIIGTGTDEKFDRVAQLAAAVLDVPIALVSFFDEQRPWIKARNGIELVQAPREWSYLPEPDSGTDIIIEINDPARDERFSRSPLVNGDSQIRFFAGAPISSPAGYTLG